MAKNIPNDNVFGVNKQWESYIFIYGVGVVLTLPSLYTVEFLMTSVERLFGMDRYKDDYSYSYNHNNQSTHSTQTRTHTMYAYTDYNKFNTLPCAMILRSLITVLIPFFVSLVLLNECGGNWASLWNECLENADSFEYSITIINWTFPVPMHEDVCGNRSLDQFINVNNGIISKCLRQFWDWWIPIICLLLF